MQNLGDPRTRLNRFFLELGNAARIVAPAAEAQAELFRNLDTTFTAISGVLDPLQASISGGPPALEAAIESFPIQRPFLANTAGFFRELRPGVHSLRTSAPILADAFETGITTLPKAVSFNKRLEDFFPAVERLATDPLVPLAIKDLTRTVNILDPALKTIAPAQTVCNYASLLLRNAASLLSDGDANGTWQRFIIVAAPQGPNNEGGPSSAPANGPNPDNYLHSNPYPNAAGAGQTNECEAGNEGYVKGRQVIGNVPGNQGLKTENQPTTKGGGG
jgi:hypothetical protein